MVANRFSTLDGCTVAVELVHNGNRKVLRGVAAYGKDPLLGEVLTVNVREAWGDFDIVLRESTWDGEFTIGTANGCDYQICVSTDCLCTKAGT
jgi:hypothetical protein